MAAAVQPVPVSVVTQPAFAGPAPTQATPDSISAAAMSFVGKAWNDEGCWVLASNISAEAGASLPITSTSLGIPGVANGEWIVAYNGPAGQTGNWELQITAGEMVVFETSATSGHITTVVSGSGSTAMLVDNITYVNGSGQIVNSANDGSPNDIIVAAPHIASQEWAMAVPGSVVVYELDCPTITVKTATSVVSAGRTEALSPLFTAANPLASQAITEYQFYDTGTGGAANDSFLVGSTDDIGHSAATAVTVNASALSSVDLLAGNTSGSDTIMVRAYNGSYWGDWESMTVNVTGTVVAAAPPTVTAQTATQTWKLGQAISFTLAGNTFTDPQQESLTYAATLSSGATLPSWLTFNTATKTFSGTIPAGAAGLSIKVTATDTSGLAASETFSVLTPAPAAPTVTAQTATQTWKLGQAVNFTLSANTFTDPQQENLTYTATLANGHGAAVMAAFQCRNRRLHRHGADQCSRPKHQSDGNGCRRRLDIGNLLGADASAGGSDRDGTDRDPDLEARSGRQLHSPRQHFHRPAAGKPDLFGNARQWYGAAVMAAFQCRNRRLHRHGADQCGRPEPQGDGDRYRGSFGIGNLLGAHARQRPDRDRANRQPDLDRSAGGEFQARHQHLHRPAAGEPDLFGNALERHGVAVLAALQCRD